jgi:hypothetical protein
MSELLDLANKLIEARAKTSPSALATSHYYEEFATLAVCHAVGVIKGYQDLLHGIVKAFDSTFEHELSEVLSPMITHARASLPEEPRR